MALKYRFNFHGELSKVVRREEQMNGVGVFQTERVQWLSLLDCVGVVCDLGIRGDERSRAGGVKEFKG